MLIFGVDGYFRANKIRKNDQKKLYGNSFLLYLSRKHMHAGRGSASENEVRAMNAFLSGQEKETEHE